MGEPNYLGGRRCKKCRGPMEPSKMSLPDDPHDGDAEWGDVGKLEASHEKQPPRPETYIDWPDDNHENKLPRGWWLMGSLMAGVLIWIGIFTTIWYLIS